MRRSLRSFAALGAVFFVGIGIAACGGIPGNAVVQVAGTPISKSTLNHWIGIAAASSSTPTTGSKAAKPAVPVPPKYTACIAHLEETAPKPTKGQPKQTPTELKSECESQYKEYKDTMLGYLIAAEWVTGEAEAMKVSMSDKEVYKKLAELKKESFPEEKKFQEYLKTSGFTISDLALRIKVELLERKIEEKVTKDAKKPPSKAEVAKYYNENKSQYGEPERRNLNIILTKTEAQASSAKSEIEGGQSFASVAKRVSIETVSKAKGGELPDVEKGEEEKALGEAVFSAKLNDLSGPVKTPFGYYVFEVTKVLKATQKPLSAVESEIKSQLSSKKEQTALTKFGKEFRKRWTAKTECRPEFTVENCKNYKKPKPVTTTTATSTSSTSSAASTSSSSSTTTTTSSSTSTK
ncbi:MAG TPA: peptidyl-prolyl cis-trans isomerase [Solirubrobacteraceae bacterium]